MTLRPRSQNRKNRAAVNLRLESLEDRAVPDATFHNLSGGNFSQNWSNANLITTDDDWSGVPSIIGFLGQDITTSTGVDPQTLLTTSVVANDVDVNANQTNPDTFATGGVAEFTGAGVNNDNVVALQGSGMADVPYLLIHLNTTNRQTITISYNLRDIDGSTDNVAQPVALQYRVGTTGNFTNLSAGYVADATTGPSLATLVTPVSVVLPAAAENQSQVQVRVMTTNAAGVDEWVGVDDITVTSVAIPTAAPSVTSPGAATAVNAATFTITGTAVANALVKVYSDANNNGLIDGADAVVSMQSLGAGVTAFSIPTTLTANAANNFVVTATATPLGESAPVDVPTITADSLAPALPVVTNPGAPTSVNAATFAVAGTAEAGSLVKVYRDVNNNNAIDAGIDTVVAQQQLSGGGVNFSIPTTLAQDTVNTFVVTATDAAGNESAPADVPTITEDSLAPALPVVTSPGAATTVSATTFTITGTAEANALVKVYSDVNNNGAIDGADAVVGMQQLGTGITAFSISVPLVANAANNFTVTATDAAANQSSPADVPTITQDSTAPALPVVTSPTSAVTVNAATFAITGTAEVNSLVRVFLDANNDGVADNPASPVAQQQLTAGATAFSISTPLTQDAANNFVVTATDVASNQSTPTDVPTITEDSTTPANPTVTSPAAPVTVNATTFAVAGTAEANALVKVYSDANNNGVIDAADTVVAQQQLTGGATRFSISVSLQHADNTFVATATDAAGNESFATDVPTITAATPPTPVPTPTPISTPTPTVSKSARAQFIAVGTDAGATAAVRVLDATTGRAVRNDIVPFGGFAGGVSVALGDVTGDGVADVIVGTATGGAHVKVFDGVTGAEVRSFLAFDGFAGGVSLAVGDVDGDGRADIIVGTADGGAHVKVFSGRDGSLLQSFFAFDGFGGGVKVAAGDVNGDRKADIAVLAGPGGNGHVKVFDAANRAQVASFLGYAGYTGEINLAVGDVDGDGRGEVVTTALNSTGGTHVKAFDTRGATVRSFFASTTAGTVATDFGSRRTARLPVVAPVEPPRVGVADVDGDGVADYLLGSPAGPATSRLFLVSGASNPPAVSPLAFDNSFGTSGVFVDVK